MLDSGTLHNHALAVLPEAYADARKQAAAETGLPRSTFPVDCRWDLESLIAEDDDTADLRQILEG